MLSLLQRVHPLRLDEYEKDMANNKVTKSSKRPGCELSGGVQKKFKQASLFGTSSEKAAMWPPQSIVDGLILDYVIQEMRPLATVEKPAFHKMLTGINPSINVMCRKTLSVRLDKRLDQMKDILKSQLSDVNYVCTTADIWTVNNKSYMGMTMHYIKADKSEEVSRVSAALSCRRFLGSHTFEHIAELISDIHSDYGLHVDKISATVTDNASNFSKAFREYLAIPDEDRNENENDDTDVISVGAVLEDEANDGTDIYLPHHETCFSHSLNLLATADASKACESDTPYRRIYRGALGKCTSIWNSTHRSSKASDAVKEVTDKSIITPGATRWNSYFEAVRRIVEIGPKLPDVCQATDTPKFKQAELECLEEYITVMQPIAVALDKLQGEKNIFFGHILPTLYTVQMKLQTMLHKPLKYSEPLLTTLLQGMQKRFGKELSFSCAVSDKIVAAVSHPYFKLRWLPEDKKDQCRNFLLMQ